MAINRPTGLKRLLNCLADAVFRRFVSPADLLAVDEDGAGGLVLVQDFGVVAVKMSQNDPVTEFSSDFAYALGFDLGGLAEGHAEQVDNGLAGEGFEGVVWLQEDWRFSIGGEFLEQDAGIGAAFNAFVAAFLEPLGSHEPEIPVVTQRGDTFGAVLSGFSFCNTQQRRSCTPLPG